MSNEAYDLAWKARTVAEGVCIGFNILYGSGPYMVHVDEVIHKIIDLMNSLPDPSEKWNLYPRTIFAAAFLHDIVEDTPITKELIEEVFGLEVSIMVDLVTDPEAPNRKERKRLLHDRLRMLDAAEPLERAALLIKIADRYCNIKNCYDNNDPRLSMYKKEWVDFCQACFRPEMGIHFLWDEMAKMLDTGMIAIG